MRNCLAAFFVCLSLMTPTLADELPDTGISGVYEVMVGVDDGDYAVRYFAEFGFRVVAQARLEESEGHRRCAQRSSRTTTLWSLAISM